jgi:hypothetical protein
MDDRRFDDLTRVFASGISRRSLVKWMAGIAGGATVVAARQSDVAAAGLGEACDDISAICTTGLDCVSSICCIETGETCSSGSQCCSQACDPNGNTCCEGLGAACPGSDCCGALTCENGFCCAPEGFNCGGDAACCGVNVCPSGTCVPPGMCLFLGESCGSDEQCCSESCDDVCCIAQGDACIDSNCCGDLECVGGFCGRDCLASNVTNPACGGSSAPDCCDANAIYNPNNCECRVLCENGVSCFTDAHCDGDEFCSGGCCVPCLADGEGVYCATEQACCSHNCDMNNCGCRSIQSDCTDDEQCCSGICSDEEPRVCLPPDGPSCEHKGAKCGEDEDCCGDLQCVHGKCGKHSTCLGEKGACDERHPCCKGYRCVDGHCKRKKRPPKSGGGGTDTVDTLPSTGAGPDERTSGWTGAILAGGAAAAAAWILRKDGGTETDDSASRES